MDILTLEDEGTALTQNVGIRLSKDTAPYFKINGILDLSVHASKQTKRER